MTPTNKSPIQDEPKKPTFVALIKKNKPEPTPEPTPKPEETSPNKTSSQSLGKKSTSSTTKSKQTTASTSSTTKSKQTTASTTSKQTEKTTTSKATEKSQSTTTPKAASQSSSKTSSKKPSNQTSKTQEVTPSTASPNRITASQNNQKGQGKSPKTQSTTNNKPQSTISQKTEDKTQSTTNPKTQDKSPTSQLKNANIDPIQKALLYKNKKKQRLGISDYQDLLSARDISLSITGITSVAAGSLLQTVLAGSLAGLFSFPALLLLAAAFAKNVFEFNRTAVDIQREEEAEKKIAQLLKDTYLETGGEIYSLLDENPLVIPDPEGYRQDYLDIGLFLPSGQFLAISVKSLKGEKDFVFFDNNTNTLRYRNCHGKKKWNVYPIDELKRQMEWLDNNLQIFKHPPIGIITLTAPTTVKVFDNVAYQIGELKVLKIDDIYVVEEKDLLDLIDKVLSREKV